jgi:hypothetical protein
MTDAEREIRDNEILDTCEEDCKLYCTGCDRLFHQIKIYDGCDCEEELPEALYLNNRDVYCHVDCFNDCH